MLSNILRATGTAEDHPSLASLCHDPTICRLVTSHIWLVVFNIVVAILLPGGLFCTANDLRTINMPTPHDVWELYFRWEGFPGGGGGGGGGLGGSSSGSRASRIPFMKWRRLLWTGVPSHRWLRVTPAGINNPSLRGDVT